MYAVWRMLAAAGVEILISMTAVDPGPGTPPLNGSEVGIDEALPTGTVTLLLADVQGSTRLWETQPQQMAAAVAQLDVTLADVVAAHGGVRPLEQGEGDSFVIAFTRASDAVACALALQQAPLSPIRLRIGVHVGEVRLRDDFNYIGPTINRTARLRDLAHGGQTVLSGTAGDLVADTLPTGARLVDLGTHPLRDLPRPERVAQLCHSDVDNDFPPLRTTTPVGSHNLPPQLTSFVGRGAQIDQVGRLLDANRLVTLTGAGGIGKTRLAIQVGGQVDTGVKDGVWLVDLAPITDPAIVPTTVARALNLPDQPGRAMIDTVTRFVGDRQMLIVLDNCEHLLDATMSAVDTLLASCPALRVLATSREPIGVAGEVTWRVPSLTVDDEAIALFTDRAKRAQPQFAIDDTNAATVREICHRLDGIPLAIELAAARMRALSPDEILDGLHDRFRLLTGGARGAARRQQTLQASVEWSHALLSNAEQAVFRRLAVFLGGFDLDAATVVAGDQPAHRYQVLDQLSLLVDKSLLIAENTTGTTRYRMLETVRQYAVDKLGESGEAAAVRTGHRNYYADLARLLDTPERAGHEASLRQIQTEIGNLRAAFAWSCENDDTDLALQLTFSLQPFWLGRGRIQEGVSWFDAAMPTEDRQGDLSPAVLARAMADRTVLAASAGLLHGLEHMQRALSTARELGEPVLLARVLTASAALKAYTPSAAEADFDEGIELARRLGDQWRLAQILSWKAAVSALIAGEPAVMVDAAEEGQGVAAAIGDHYHSHACQWARAAALAGQGYATRAADLARSVAAEADGTADQLWKVNALITLAGSLAHGGDVAGAAAAVEEATEPAAELGGHYPGFIAATNVVTALAAGDAALARERALDARPLAMLHPPTGVMYLHFLAAAALGSGDLDAARDLAEEAVAANLGAHLALALTRRAEVAIARGEVVQAERDARAALACAVDAHAEPLSPHALEILALSSVQAGGHAEAARLFAGADAIRQVTGDVRFPMHQANWEIGVGTARDALGQEDFDAAWAEGAALSTEEAIAYALRGRGPRKRRAHGWAALTPTERDVVRLVGEGLGNKEIGSRLFISPRTVQTHLTHVYAKVGVNSRVQLAQEATRHT
jgi:predicted ATPase/class 3 adenylate cyclase/DNA-binding CsgD family transcriptional regulator